MEDVLTRKQRIVESHMANIAKQNLEILKLTDKAMKDRKFGVNVDIGIFDKLKGLVQLNRDEFLGMNGDQRLEYAKMWSENAKNMLDIFKNDPGYQSILKDIDVQMEVYRQELDRLNEELKKVEDEDRRTRLEAEKRRIQSAY